MLTLLRSLRRHRRLIRGFVGRDLRARYVGSTMGFFWSVVFPIVNLFVFMFVFRLVLKARFGDMSPQETAIYMLAGILVWSAFAEALTRSTNCLVDNANLIQKVIFPSEILPVHLAISSLVNMLIGLPIVVVGALVILEPPGQEVAVDPNHQEVLCAPGALCCWDRWADWDRPEEEAAPAEAAASGSASLYPLGPQLILIPLLLVLQALFTVGLGYVLATFNVLWRDTFHLVGVAVQVWMFATPIFYPPTAITATEYGLDWMLAINPMHWLIECWRQVLIFQSWPDPGLMLRFTAVALGVFALGSTFFQRQKRAFPDLL